MHFIHGRNKNKRQFGETLKERMKHPPPTHPYKRTSVIKVSEEISEMYLNAHGIGCVFGLIVEVTS